MAKKNDDMKASNVEDSHKLLFAIRIRGNPGMKRKILDTLKMLRMHKINHGVLIWSQKSYMGMLQKCKDYIAFGPIDEETLIKLLKKRGKIEGDKPLSDTHLKNLTKYKSVEDFAKALLSGEIQYKEKEVSKLKPVFRLHPPRQGHRGTIKRHYGAGGVLGNVGDYINEMIDKML